ncbi:DUF3168 domain-containing protein [Pasteurella multocida]|uniref:DUF3168 domain-containing protein n=1 Tax=Pasteurella multocida TaxID=747 RepID=UPI0029BC68E7|nr:DUF3168 domain-containing protein [Pasteurella multocida]MDX3898711.1 DUF3168 domain-containing protein [Pasteurella multocida]MDX3956598.1 DUF3168 domain-containing protein [Pasteurella multocida]HDR1420255.1 DUF3168 domain-containing protein [Pasteurella multocida]HDR1425105.1 DUF3168 domain-containing protein [Pasteurella multocida]HDR1428981.1 DUF3168 domain-containing protein [Pasteurella multocida]
MIQTKIYQALSPLVGGLCFYGFIPETSKKFPVIVYQFPNISPNSALEDGDLDDFLVQIDVYSPNPDDIFKLRQQVISALQTKFEYCERINDHTDYEPDEKLHRRVFSFQIAHGDSI